jgi:hypothetical protein
MMATYSTETSVDFQRNTRPYIPEDRTLHNYRCEYLKSYFLLCYILLYPVVYLTQFRFRNSSVAEMYVSM